jgi:hypothetical protein
LARRDTQRLNSSTGNFGANCSHDRCSKCVTR